MTAGNGEQGNSRNNGTFVPKGTVITRGTVITWGTEFVQGTVIDSKVTFDIRKQKPIVTNVSMMTMAFIRIQKPFSAIMARIHLTCM